MSNLIANKCFPHWLKLLALIINIITSMEPAFLHLIIESSSSFIESMWLSTILQIRIDISNIPHTGMLKCSIFQVFLHSNQLCSSVISFSLWKCWIHYPFPMNYIFQFSFLHWKCHIYVNSWIAWNLTVLCNKSHFKLTHAKLF